MYSTVNLRSITDFQGGYMGVKQGEPLLPFWFLLYINGIQECLLSNYIDSLTIREKQLSYVVIPDIFLFERKVYRHCKQITQKF